VPLEPPFSGPRSTNFKGFHVGLSVWTKDLKCQADEGRVPVGAFRAALPSTLPFGPSGSELIKNPWEINLF